MEYNFLGRSGLLVSRLGYGNMANFQPQDEEVNIQIIKKAYDAGINFFDTAEIYENGEAEKQLGRSLKVLNIQRQNVIITTKFIANNLAGGNKVNRFFTLNRKHIIDGLGVSLNNLQLDYVDIAYAHNVDLDTPIEEICRGFNQVIEDGKAFYWATSNWSAQLIQQAINFCDKHDLIRPIADQSEYHMLERKKLESEFRPLYENHGYGTTIYSPLSGGFLTGKYLDEIPEGSRCGQDNGWMGQQRMKARWIDKWTNNPDNVIGLRNLVQLAKELGCTSGQLAIAWVLRNKDINVAITGARSVKQIEESIESLNVLKKFDANLDEKLEKIFNNRPATELDFRKFGPTKNRR